MLFLPGELNDLEEDYSNRCSQSYREENHRDSQSYGHQHSQTHTQEEDVQGVNTDVGVEQLRLHSAYQRSKKHSLTRRS